MGRRDRKRPHGITPTDELLAHLLDEVEEIVDVLRRVFPEPPPPDEPDEQPASEEPAAEAEATTIPIEEPEPAPRKRAPRKATGSKKPA